MSKAYSNKALPAGTVIREWRLEDVLGVGGFGIVYRGRGIYFGELVAIKEYFPSSISERDAEDTVVPIGSDVEEVHALGLKKFVEEAKLLWNLSTPSRHPNIVSVRSLFEIHGTAYMVMDFEDGLSLSKLLKEGRRFNERSLWNIIQPIAAGLDRAHRVGVLHRDIKPPNILITEDNRPVLIDFGSARFEAAEATSTTVTFHTPPYAAIEQYVKTYPQGPWTDIYAMAVVLYECVTGEKPPEVLERLHGELGQPLADGHWPGFGKRFLQAIDAGMTIRPAERPQSIRAWLALFGKKDVEAETDNDESPTRFFSHEVATEEIVPVAPLAPGFDPKVAIETQVPTDPGDAQFKRAGEETHVTEKRKKDAAIATGAVSEIADKGETAPPIAPTEPAVPAQSKKADAAHDRKMPLTARPAPSKRLLVGAGAAALLVAAATGAIMFGKGNSDGGAASVSNPESAGGVATPSGGSDVSQLVSAARSLADDGRNAGAPEAAVNGLVAAGDQLDQQSRALQPLLNDPKQTAAATARSDEMKGVATAANMAFANALLRDAEATAQKLALNVPSTSPSGARLQSALSSLRAIVQTPVNGIDPDLSLTVARNALASSKAFVATLPAAFGQQTATKRAVENLAQSSKKTLTSVTPRAVASSVEVAPVVTEPAAAATIGVSPAKLGQFGAIIGSARSLAVQVIRMGDRDPQARENAKLAKNYDAYLRTLSDSMRGAKTDRDADRLIKQASQTKAYLVFLNKQSSK